MKIVKSKNIHSIHYEPKTRTVEITFHGSKATYEYHNVSEREYIAFENAKSYGKHFAEHIKDKFKVIKHHGRKK